MPPMVPGGVFAPTTTTFRYTSGTELYGTPMSTSPLVPKPVAVLRSRRRARSGGVPAVTKMMRGGRSRSPGQYVTPRRDGRPDVKRCRQSSLPLGRSSATTLSAAGRYMTPATTIGVACEFGFRSAGAARSRCCVASEGERPCAREPGHVGRVDLRQRRVAGPRRVATIRGPVGRGRRRCRALRGRARLRHTLLRGAGRRHEHPRGSRDHRPHRALRHHAPPESRPGIQPDRPT